MPQVFSYIGDGPAPDVCLGRALLQFAVAGAD